MSLRWCWHCDLHYVVNVNDVDKCNDNIDDVVDSICKIKKKHSAWKKIWPVIVDKVGDNKRTTSCTGHSSLKRVEIGACDELFSPVSQPVGVNLIS